MVFAALVFAAPLAEPSAPITVTGHSWAPFISPMGEPFRARSTSDDTLAAWFHQADRNHDGFLTADEMVADAERFFTLLDMNHDGEIDPEELDHYEWQIAPEIQVNSRTRRTPGQRAPASSAGSDLATGAGERRHGRSEDDDTSLGLHGALQGAARYGLLNIPEPVASADADFNRAVSLDEFRKAAIERFELLDLAQQGKITLDQLQRLREELHGAASSRKSDKRARDARLGNALPREL